MNAKDFGTRSGHCCTRPLLVDHLLKSGDLTALPSYVVLARPARSRCTMRVARQPCEKPAKEKYRYYQNKCGNAIESPVGAAIRFRGIFADVHILSVHVHHLLCHIAERFSNASLNSGKACAKYDYLSKSVINLELHRKHIRPKAGSYQNRTE